MLSAKDIAELEKKYSKFIFKKRFKSFLFIFIFALLASSSLYYLFDYYKSQLNVEQKKPIEKQQDKNISVLFPTKETNTSVKIKTEIQKQPLKESKTIITPEDKNISNDEKNTSIALVENNTTKDEFAFKIHPSKTFTIDRANRGKLVFIDTITTKSPNKPIETKPNIPKNTNKNATITKKKDKKPKIDIEMKDIDSIKYLNDKFKKTHDIVFALMLCESYYNQKDYKNSLKWSIIANDIDSSSERSWIWFAKSKYRLHQRDDAVKALRSFLRTNSSQKVKSLLRDIINGVLND